MERQPQRNSLGLSALSFSTNLHRNRGRITKIATDLTSSRRVPQGESIGPLGKFLPTCNADLRRCGSGAYAAAANWAKDDLILPCLF